MIKPLKDKIYFTVIDTQEKVTQTGFMLAPDKKVKTVFGKIISVGEEVKDFKKGDKIIFPNYAPFEIDIKGKKIYCIAEELVLGIYEEDHEG